MQPTMPKTFWGLWFNAGIIIYQQLELVACYQCDLEQNNLLEILHHSQGLPDFYMNTKISFSCAAKGFKKI